MTREEKQLLLKDLCARLPYGVTCHIEDDSDFEGSLPAYDCKLSLGLFGKFRGHSFDLKPYLRPMSSMTEEEKIEYNKYINYRFSNEKDGMVSNVFVFVDDVPDYIDWLNAHYFDYRGLIPMGLALEAKEGMYSI